MKMTTERYCIVSKSFPLMFCDEKGYECDDIEDAAFFLIKKTCEDELNTYDEPENFQILNVKVTYEF